MGIQDRDYYREWWRKRNAAEEPHQPAIEPVRSTPAPPKPLPPFVAWVVLAASAVGALVFLGKLLQKLIA